MLRRANHRSNYSSSLLLTDGFSIINLAVIFFTLVNFEHDFMARFLLISQVEHVSLDCFRTAIGLERLDLSAVLQVVRIVVLWLLESLSPT